MTDQERILAMKLNMLKLIERPDVMEDYRIEGRPASMAVSFWDGPGIQFKDAAGKPMLPDFIREEELAIALWNALTDNAPIDPRWFD